MEAEDNGQGDPALDKQCGSAEATADEYEREAEESRSNLKYTDDA